MNIDQRTLLITGASSGIGAAVARLASAEGAKVVLVARRLDRLEELAAELPEALAVQADVTDRAQLDAAVEAALARFGTLDVLINNAGQGLHVPLMEVRAEDFRAILELNLIGALGAMQAAAEVMRRQGEGAIVNVSSGSALKVPPGVGAYAASKAALDMITAVARVELEPSGIVVSNIHPFVTATEFHDSLRAGSLEGSFAAHSSEHVAEVILDQVRTGAADANLIPTDFVD